MSGAGVATMRVRDGHLCEAVLTRAFGVMAAHADLPVDRLADTQLVAEAIARQGTRHFADGAVQAELSWAPRRVRIALGPLSAGGAARMLEDSTVPGVGPVLERVVDEVVTVAEGDRETLELVIRAGREGAEEG